MTAPTDLSHLTPTMQTYPSALRRHLGEGTPPVIAARGNLDLLRQPLLAFFCSVRCPGSELLACIAHHERDGLHAWIAKV